MLGSTSRDVLPFHCKFDQKSGRPKWGQNEVFSRRGKSRFLDGKGGLLARARVGFWVRKDGEPWSYRSSHPESVPTCLPHWCSLRRTESACRETHRSEEHTSE